MTTTAIQRLRRDVGLDIDDTTTLSDTDAQDLLDEAAESYGTDTGATYAYARVLTLRGLRAQAAYQVTYRVAESSENASDLFGHLDQLIAEWQAETARLVNVGAGASTMFTTADGGRGR